MLGEKVGEMRDFDFSSNAVCHLKALRLGMLSSSQPLRDLYLLFFGTCTFFHNCFMSDEQRKKHKRMVILER